MCDSRFWPLWPTHGDQPLLYNPLFQTNHCIQRQASDLHLQVETKHDQDHVDKPHSNKTDGSVKEGEKRNDKRRYPESMYAVVDKSRAKSKTLGAISSEEASITGSSGWKDGTDTSQTLSSYSKQDSPSERQPSGQKPPRVVPYHLSKRRASTATQAQAGQVQTADQGEDGLVKDDSRQRNVEVLVYADLDLSQGSARVINPEEETVYADIGNKKTVGKILLDI